jgi:enediyne biosynthesis protein E4
VRTRPKLFPLLVVAGVALATAVFVFIRKPHRVEDGWVRPNSPETESPADPKSGRRFSKIDTQQRQLDDTIWAKEIEAQEHEEVFVRLWDQLRTSNDQFSILERFPFGELTIGTLGTNSSLATANHGIAVSRLSEPLQSYKPAQWAELLKQFKDSGYQLQQSEWRHGLFDPSQTNSPARSTVAVSLHVINRNKEQRLIIRGDLQVVWQAKTKDSAELIPDKITAANLEILSRDGRPPFRRVLSGQLAPEFNPIFVDPLIVSDLNSDGLPDIVFGCKNLIYLNQGGGKFEALSISPQLTNAINVAVLADFNGDSLPDFLAAHSGGLLLFRGDGKGHFNPASGLIRFTHMLMPSPFVLTAGDIDKDGDLDIWLAQYKLPYVAGQMPTPYYDANDGFPSFLLQNDGAGNFVDVTDESGLAPKRFRRTHSSSFIDLDADGDLDLVNVSDFAGVDLYYNDGRGHFTDVTSTKLPNDRRGFGTGLALGDFDGDGSTDLFFAARSSFVADRLEALKLGPAWLPKIQRYRHQMAHGNHLFLRRGEHFEVAPSGAALARSGWPWGVTAFDFDNDGDLDLYVANGYKSRPSARDYESQFWRHDLYVATSRHDSAVDVYFRSMAGRMYGAGYSYAGYEKNQLFINDNGQTFIEASYLMGAGLELDCRNVVNADFDADGRVDLLVSSTQEWPKLSHGFHLFQNRSASRANWIGFQLRALAPGDPSPIGARVVLVTANRRQVRHLTTGDSFRSQHPTSAHFGLGTETDVERVEFHYPNRPMHAVEHPEINRYHLVEPPGSKPSKTPVPP